jgi:hypothetical protein
MAVRSDLSRRYARERSHDMSEAKHQLIEVHAVPRRAFLISLGMVAAALEAGIRPAFAAPYQNDWARCIHCNLMFFNRYRDNKGRCAAPGRRVHEAERGDFKKYQITYDDSTGRGQGDWRYCRKCSALFFNGYAEKGLCAADKGGHEAAGWNFFLYHDRRPTQNEEAGWRYCSKCHALFNGSTNQERWLPSRWTGTPDTAH